MGMDKDKQETMPQPRARSVINYICDQQVPHVQLAPGMDALLFLGTACAIDCIHHEGVEDEWSRRN